MLLLQFFLLFSAPKLTYSCFSNKDIEIISSMLQYLQMEEYILVSEFCDALIPKLKYLSKNNISGMYLKLENLIFLLENQKIIHRRTMVILKSESETGLQKIREILKEKVSDKKVFTMFVWLMFLPKNYEKLTKNNFHVPFDCQFYIVDELEVKGIYQIKRNSEMIYSYFGKYTNKGLQSNISYLYENKLNMRGESLIMKINNQVKCRFLPECLHLELWEEMGRILNFKTRFAKVSELEKSTNILIPDAHTNISIIHHVLQNVDRVFGPLTKNLAHLYIEEIDEDEDKWDSYFRPFDIKLWLAVISCIFLSSLVVLATAWIAQTCLHLKGFTLYDQALAPLSAFCNQGCEYLPNIASSRIARIFVYVASAVILPAYSASLISFLTVHIPIIPFTDFESLAEEGHYKLAPLNNPFMVSFFRDNADPAIKKIMENQLVPLEMFPRTHFDAIKLVCSGDEISVINYNYRMFQFPATCPIIRVSDEVFEHFSGIGLLNEGLHYRKLFQEMLVPMYSSGIMEKIQKINYGKMSLESDYEVEAIGILETKYLMLFYISCIFIVIFVFLCEFVYKFIRNFRPRNLPKKVLPVLLCSDQNIRRVRQRQPLHISTYFENDIMLI